MPRVPASAAGGDLAEHQDAVRRAGTVAVFAFAAFAAVDVYMHFVVYPDGSLRRVLALRALGVLLLIAHTAALRRPDLGRNALDAIVVSALSTTAAAVAVMSTEGGGLTSLNTHGLAFFFAGCAALIPAPWPRMLLCLLPVHLAYFGALAAAVSLDDRLASQWSSSHDAAIFSVHLVFQTAMLAFSTVSGHLLWRSRRQLYQARRLGRYRLTAQLGEGGMNEVWLARDVALRRDVALKLLRAAPNVDATRWLRFEREAQATSALASPHTIKIFDYGASDDGVAYIAMEYLRGMDLDRMVRRYGRLEPRRAVHFVRQACLSLAEAHERGLVHRDIKPANLFALSSPAQEDFLKVLDFGVVHQRGPAPPQAPVEGAMIGTPMFMSPEQFVDGDATPAADVYAVGATLYHLLCGAPPFDAARTAQLGRAHAQAPVVPPSKRRGDAVPPALEAIIARCLAKHPVDRYRDGGALLRALDDLPEVAPWGPADARAWWARVRLRTSAGDTTSSDGTESPDDLRAES
jgi:eukaryotic-like serine/threonine-protein kinase